MTTEEKLDRLTTIVETLASTVVQHDDQIAATGENLKALAESVKAVADFDARHQVEILELRKEAAETQRLLQAYLRRLPPQ
jgi:ABC-type transporter Mla subunit MlaD